MKLYHASHCVNRPSIERHGLLINATEGEAVCSITGGIFFSSKRPDPSEQIDVWEVDIVGLPIKIDDTDSPPDPDDTWWVVYGLTAIEPQRLRLVMPASAKFPEHFRCGEG